MLDEFLLQSLNVPQAYGHIYSLFQTASLHLARLARSLWAGASPEAPCRQGPCPAGAFRREVGELSLGVVLVRRCPVLLLKERGGGP